MAKSKKKPAAKKAAPKKKTVAKKAPTSKKKETVAVPKDHVVVTVAKVVVDQDHRPAIFVEMKDGTTAWLPKSQIKKRDGKKFTIPKFLKELKKI